MKPLVIDTSVAINWYVPQTYTLQALNLLQQYTQQKWEFLAPNHIYAKFGNGIWRLERAKLLSSSRAKEALEKFRAQPLLLTSAFDLLEDAYTIAIQYNRSVYDSLYIALAQRENTTFVTADEKLVNAVGGQLPVTFLANWS